MAVSLSAVAGPHIHSLNRELDDLNVSEGQQKALSNAIYSAVLQALVQAGHTVVDDRP